MLARLIQVGYLRTGHQKGTLRVAQVRTRIKAETIFLGGKDGVGSVRLSSHRERIIAKSVNGMPVVAVTEWCVLN